MYNTQLLCIGDCAMLHEIDILPVWYASLARVCLVEKHLDEIARVVSPAVAQ